MIQPRELDILYALLRYRYLETSQIHRLFFDGQSLQNMYRIVKKLAQRGLLERKNMPRQPGLNLGAMLYLTKKGANLLARETGKSTQELGYRRIVYPIESPNFAYHRKRMIDFYIALDESLEEMPLELKYLSMDYEKEVVNGRRVSLNKLEDSRGQMSVIPDLIAIVQNRVTGSERVYFVEIDTGKETIGGGGRLKTAPLHSLLDKYLRYETILKDRSWQRRVPSQVKGFEVLTVTETLKHIRTMQRQIPSHLRYGRLFRCATHQQIQQGGLLTQALWYALAEPYGAQVLFHQQTSTS